MGQSQMIAAWHFVQEWSIISMILVVAGVASYLLKILHLPGGITAAVAGIVLAAAWYWHAGKLNDVRADYQRQAVQNEAVWAARIKQIDAATHAQELNFTQSLKAINYQRSKDSTNAKILLDNAVAIAKRDGLRDPFAKTGCSAASTVETGAVAGVGAEATGSRLSNQFAEMLLIEAGRADQIVAESNAVKQLLGAVYKSCQ